MIKKIIEFCKKNQFVTIEIQSNSSNILLPQNIILYLKKSNPEILQGLYHGLIDKFEIIFKKGNLFSQFALISSFPDINNWKEYIYKPLENEIQDTEGGYLFDIDTLKFINKPIGFTKDLALIKFTNINGYKTIYRMWHSGICYNIPEQQLGIYLYLYLFKQIASYI